MIHFKDNLIHVGTYVLDSFYVYIVDKIEIDTIVDASNFKQVDKELSYYLQNNRTVKENYKIIYNLGDPYTKKYHLLKRYKIIKNTLKPINGKVHYTVHSPAHLHILDDSFLKNLIKDMTDVLKIYNSLLQKSKEVSSTGSKQGNGTTK